MKFNTIQFINSTGRNQSSTFARHDSKYRCRETWRYTLRVPLISCKDQFFVSSTAVRFPHHDNYTYLINNLHSDSCWEGKGYMCNTRLASLRERIKKKKYNHALICCTCFRPCFMYMYLYINNAQITNGIFLCTVFSLFSVLINICLHNILDRKCHMWVV